MSTDIFKVSYLKRKIRNLKSRHCLNAYSVRTIGFKKDNLGCTAISLKYNKTGTLGTLMEYCIGIDAIKAFQNFRSVFSIANK